MNFQGYAEIQMNPIDILDLKRFKGAVFSYSSHSPYVQQMLNSWAIQDRIILQAWKDLATAILEADSQL